MARKRQWLEDDDSDSSSASDNNLDDPGLDDNNPDAREERALFEDPYKRKRRRKNAKEDAIYGVFGSEDEGGEDEPGLDKSRKRSDWTKAPAFVSGEKAKLEKTTDEVMEDVDEAQSDKEESMAEDEDLDDEGEDSSDLSKPASPRIREEEEEAEIEVTSRVSGIGIGASKRPPAGVRSAFSKGGIGSSRTTFDTPEREESIPSASFPSAFGGAKIQRSFVRDGSGGSSTPKPTASLSASERVHFSKLGGTFGAKMLQKMGWQAGSGLGTTGEGIVTPVESKLRPKGMGLAFKGFKEKTAQSKAEARRKGEVVSDDEDEQRPKKPRKTGQTTEKERSDAWKKPKKVRTKVEHKTYEQIVAEAGQEPHTDLGQIIDATGATPREVSSLADVSMASWTPSTDPMRLPEVRHNLRLITESCKGELDGLAREARALEERRTWVKQEDARLRKQVDEEADLIARLQQINIVVDDINAQAKDMASSYETSLEPFSPNFEKLLGNYANEFDKYRLDEVVVAAIAPIVRRMLAQWQPLQDPTAFTSTFRLWRKALKMAAPKQYPESQIQTFGSSVVVSRVPTAENPMTPYESLIWNAWLPKVRTCINNDWSPEDPQPAVRLYEAWSAFLPPFVQDNFFDQLVLPKVHKAVGDWNPRRSKVPLQTLVFPWLPHVGLRLEEVLDDARRKVKSLLRAWVAAEGIPQDLIVWKDVFNTGEWDTMLLKYVVPKLGARLRDDFRINPRSQDMIPFQDVMVWGSLIRPSVFSHLLEVEFFPKWLDVLHVWLIQPNPSLEQVAQWYTFWKETFPENVQEIPGVAQGFVRGLQLMNKAIELGPEAPTRLLRPEYNLRASSPSHVSKQNIAKPRAARTQEITFRSIVEEYASSHNLLFIPTGRAHEKSRMPLFRVSQSVDGKGGLLVYILDDAVWAPDGDEYRAITLEDMVLRATKG